jgi:hypothetical protein
VIWLGRLNEISAIAAAETAKIASPSTKATNVARTGIVEPRLIVSILHIARYPLSDSFVEIIGHETNINVCEPSAIKPQQTMSAFNTRDACLSRTAEICTIVDRHDFRIRIQFGSIYSNFSRLGLRHSLT